MTVDRANPGSLVVACLATASASLLAFNQSPSPTFLNQALALAAWGLAVGVLAGGLTVRAWRETAAVGAALLAVGVVALVTMARGDWPSTFALSTIGLLAATGIVLAAGWSSARRADGRDVWRLLCLAWALTGLVNAGIAAVQVFAPELADGTWIARSAVPGKAVGNLRQPNHLSSLMMWSVVALVPLVQGGWLRHRLAIALMAASIGTVVLTASRTGLVSVILLAAWGLVDRRLGVRTRALLLAAPVVYAIVWGAMAAWASDGSHAFAARDRLAATDLTSSRAAVWSDTVSLIREQPWRGVGLGHFNLAWSLTPLPDRPTAFFDHTHNLPLQLLVELGVPLGGAVLALLLVGLWQAWRRSVRSVEARTAFMFVLMIGLHSLLEYPLWYAYFLLPTAWAWGHALARPATPPSAVAAEPRSRLWPLAGAAMVAGAVASVTDYQRVVRIFEPARDARSLAERVADGRGSVLFGHHADYAAATGGMAQRDGLTVFERPAHYLLDTRLLVAWAQALEAAGHDDEARHVAARLREFGAQRAAEFFARCGAPAAAAPRPAWCGPPQRQLGWRDFDRSFRSPAGAGAQAPGSSATQ